MKTSVAASSGRVESSLQAGVNGREGGGRREYTVQKYGRREENPFTGGNEARRGGGAPSYLVPVSTSFRSCLLVSLSAVAPAFSAPHLQDGHGDPDRRPNKLSAKGRRPASL